MEINMKKRILLLIIALILIVPISVKAATKENIIGLFDKTEVCDAESKKALNQYQVIFHVNLYVQYFLIH